LFSDPRATNEGNVSTMCVSQTLLARGGAGKSLA